MEESNAENPDPSCHRDSASETATPMSLIESMIGTLRSKNKFGSAGLSELNRLKELIEAQYAHRDNGGVMEIAISQSPWLTRDANRLIELKTNVTQLANLIYQRAVVNSPLPLTSVQLIEQLNNLAEQYGEAEVAQDRFLRDAFPGPDWVNQ